MSQAEIGVIGMGVMGSNLALNISEKGFKVAVWNRNDALMRDVIRNAGQLATPDKWNVTELMELAWSRPRVNFGRFHEKDHITCTHGGCHHQRRRGVSAGRLSGFRQ